ncbi:MULTISPECIES: hypothetical protein [unclassified Streptomyces]|uniref:hypothetical protein n=1 Tax=unclassified Streptomyces TaxID=2593676 RepID=UPI002E1442C8|nr:hypothetical protein OG452_27265 [Streptomyces sp. NBC_01197]WSS48517.1 hypothetical protein OG708_07585 [Streptomyces sp. NBC_01180]
MTDLTTTHTIGIGPTTVVKRFRSWDREWQTLTLLARYAPGLAPVPLERTAAPPTSPLEQPAAMVTEMFTLPDVEYLEIAHDLSNASSAAIPRRLGFTEACVNRENRP